MSATVVVGVGGGVAAFKAATLVREIARAGHEVRVIPTPSALEFVGTATWEALSGAPVHVGVFDAGGADHVEIAREADLIVIAPATADLMARMRSGMANDLLTTTLLASRCPVVIAPAMHTAMWEHPATQENRQVLLARGIHVLDPLEGALSSGDSGKGRMQEPEEIARIALNILAQHNSVSEHARSSAGPVDLEGRQILITAGGTHEAIDPVRFIGNHSSGRQGIALARRARERGAEVTLIAANVEAALLPTGVNIVPVVSAADMEEAVNSRLHQSDAVIMAAAVADYRPSAPAHMKLKKSEEVDVPQIVLERTPDILAGIATSPHRPACVVGFAAETGSVEQVLAYGQEKARRKGADLLVVNPVGEGRGFGDVPNDVHFVGSDGSILGKASGTKDDVACAILDRVSAILASTMEQ